jgi:hypothetical protein
MTNTLMLATTAHVTMPEILSSVKKDLMFDERSIANLFNHLSHKRIS